MKKGSVILILITIAVVAGIAYWVYKNALKKSETVEVSSNIGK